MAGNVPHHLTRPEPAETTPCPHCHGQRFVDVPYWHESLGGNDGTTVPVMCGRCHGSGYAPQEPETPAPCPKCQSLGWVAARLWHPADQRPTKTRVEVVCWECDGTGTAPSQPAPQPNPLAPLLREALWELDEAQKDRYWTGREECIDRIRAALAETEGQP